MTVSTKQLPVFHLMHRAYSALFRAADQAMKSRYGLTASQNAVLFTLIREDGLPITAIADRLNMGKSSLTGLVDRMAAAGLVTRNRAADDGRRSDIFITPQGRALAQDTLVDTKAMNKAMLAPFSEAEREVISRFLTHVSDKAADVIQD